MRRSAFAALLLGAVALAGLAFLHHSLDRRGPLEGHAVVVIPKGKGVAEISRLLERHRIISSPLLFVAGVRLAGKQSALRAGEYDFPGGVSARGVMDILVSGRTVVRKLTVPEGLTSAQVVKLVHGAYGLDGPLVEVPEEGSLMPDTYHYSYGDGRAQMILRMEHAMTRAVAELWPKRMNGLLLRSPREAVILASIVERETAKPEERPLVAAVFLNRLKKGMALQSDPTVAYGIAVREAASQRILGRALTRADLATPGPYNTYLNKGLPPDPIANPGREALLAVLHPAPTKALYFVADGSGGHAFSRTLDEHNRNVRRWRRLKNRGAITGEAGKATSP
ncbi:MAG: endolytic transglycosylase MltG [Alphaproteobacteria bacterium]|nr:endolytic transglycosylase MltG [Alphaproteobacteria bacterium]